MQMRLAKRMEGIGVESAFDVLVRARAIEAQGRSVIHLEIGEPDFATPPHIVEAAKQALDEGWTHYGPAQGLPELREAIADVVSETRGVAVKPERVCVVPGGKPILFFPMLALLEPGDEVIYPNPGFPIYESMIRFLGATPVPMPFEQEREFAIDLDRFAASLNGRTRMVILNSPQNPTGMVIPESDLRAIAELVRERDHLIVLSDEIYGPIHYTAEPPFSIASVPGMLDQTIILDGFSKTYAMTGWRLGYGVLPQWLVEPVNKLLINSTSCTASFTQRAGIAALRGSQEPVRAMVDEFRARRDYFCPALDQIPGFRCTMPDGAFYAWVNVRDTGRTSRELADLLLNEAGVAALDGAGFGEYGKGYLRFSYANSLENLREAIARIDGLMRDLPGRL